MLSIDGKVVRLLGGSKTRRINWGGKVISRNWVGNGTSVPRWWSSTGKQLKVNLCCTNFVCHRAVQKKLEVNLRLWFLPVWSGHNIIVIIFCCAVSLKERGFTFCHFMGNSRAIHSFELLGINWSDCVCERKITFVWPPISILRVIYYGFVADSIADNNVHKSLSKLYWAPSRPINRHHLISQRKALIARKNTDSGGHIVMVLR